MIARNWDTETADKCRLPAICILTPCDACAYNPPGSGDGKPCTMCPAERGSESE